MKPETRIRELESRLACADDFIAGLLEELRIIQVVGQPVEVPRCSYCGQSTPPIVAFGRQTTKQKIYDFIARHPECTRAEIVPAVYGDNSRGMSVISQHLSAMRPHLQSRGLAIVSEGCPARYRLVALLTQEAKDRMHKRHISKYGDHFAAECITSRSSACPAELLE